MVCRRLVPLAAAALLLGACNTFQEPVFDSMGEAMVITTGAPPPGPVGVARIGRLSTLEDATASLGGMVTTPLFLDGDGCEAFPSRDVVITFRVSGNQASAASFDIYRVWDYDGTSFVGSDVLTIDVPPLSGGGDRFFPATITVGNSSSGGSGATSLQIVPFNLVTNVSDPPGQRLSIGPNSGTTIYVEFEACESENTPPTLFVPNDMTAEATSSNGADVGFVVTADDAEDGDLTAAVVCERAADGSPAVSGDTYPIGATEVECSVTDSGGLSAAASFFIHVQDTLAPVFTQFPAGLQSLTAANIFGAMLDLDDFDIDARDYGPQGANGEVSPPVTIACTIDGQQADGFLIAIGQTATVSCTATDSADYRAPVPEGESAPEAPNARTATFDVFVTVDVDAGCGFGTPLRPEPGPYSAHKANSTIPHKVCPPTYADGTPAIDLADGLRLVLQRQPNGVGSVDPIEANDYSAGSTVWRYDATDGHYIFNVKTQKAWAAGQYSTIASFAGIDLAWTYFELRP